MGVVGVIAPERAGRTGSTSRPGQPMPVSSGRVHAVDQADRWEVDPRETQCLWVVEEAVEMAEWVRPVDPRL